MVDERGLVRLMKEAWKTKTGYIMANLNGGLYIQTDAWEVLIPGVMVPRKVLALMVEHVGSFLRDGEAVCCSKNGGAQEVALQFLQNSAAKMEKAENLKRAERTRLAWDGYDLWQSEENLQILGVAPEYEALVSVEAPGAPFFFGASVMWKDEAYICVRGVQLPPVVGIQLSAYQWIGGKG